MNRARSGLARGDDRPRGARSECFELRRLNGWRRMRRFLRQTGSGQNFLQFAGAYDGVYFRNVLLNLIVKTLD